MFRLYAYTIYNGVNIYPENNGIKGGFFSHYSESV